MRTHSEHYFQKAQKVLVGGVNSPVRSFKGVGGIPIFLKKGSGSHIFSEDGHSYIDYVMSWGPHLFGHAPKEITDAVVQAAQNSTSFGASCAPEIELAELIQHFYPSCEKIRLVCSGTEATMTAIRVARGYTNRKKIVKFNGCYHGHSDSLLVKAGSGGLTLGIPDSAGVLPELTEHTIVCEFNDIVGIEKTFSQFGNDLAAVILEPYPGNMGLIIPDSAFMKTLRQLCSANGTVLIFDEVMCGFRVAKGGAQELLGITPDLTCLGKVIGGGLPCAAFGGKEEIMNCLAPLGSVYQAGTLSGNPICVAAGIAMLKLLRNHPEKFDHAVKMTHKLAQGLTDILSEYKVPHCINHVGTMFTLFFRNGPVHNLTDVKASNNELFKLFFHGMLNEGVYLAPSQYEANFMSSEHSERDIDQTLSAARAVISELTVPV